MTLSSSENLPDIIAILPAAGVGRRMQLPFPKQYLTIGGTTLLECSISILLQQPCIRQIIVAISPNDHWFHQLQLSTEKRVKAVTGGRERAESVMAALLHAKHADWVLVHDAARPFLNKNDLLRLLMVTGYSRVGGILARPVHDTIKRAFTGKKTIDYTVERTDLWHALTPQLFMLELLKRCLKQALSKNIPITDEASALEYCGYQPLLVPAYTHNIKVTYPEDLRLVHFYFPQFCKQESL